MTVNGSACSGPAALTFDQVAAGAGKARGIRRPLANHARWCATLVADMREFFRQVGAAPRRGHFKPTRTRHDGFLRGETRERRGRASEVAAGGSQVHRLRGRVCYAACPTWLKWNRDYLGPPRLNRAWTLVK